MSALVLVRGGGEIGSSIAMRLARSEARVIVTETPQPRALRRTTSFAEAVYERETLVEETGGRLVQDASDTLRILSIMAKQQVPVLVDGPCASARGLHPMAIVDARMLSRPPERIGYAPQLYIGIGPGFEAGVNCQAVVGVRAGFDLGRVYWKGGPPPEAERSTAGRSLLPAPEHGRLITHADIGARVAPDQLIAEVQTEQDERYPIRATSEGILWGLMHDGITVTAGTIVAEIAPAEYQEICHKLSEEALAIAGGVIEALMSKTDIRKLIW